MILLEDGPGGQRKESYYTTEPVALLSASFKMMAGHSREGRAQLPDSESSDGTERAEVHSAGSQGITLGPQVLSKSAVEGAGWVPSTGMNEMLRLPD